MMARFALLMAILACSACSAPSQDGVQCSAEALAGNWLFATGIGRQSLGAPFPPDSDMTAIGTMTIGRDGDVSGTFDATVEDAVFLPDTRYTGSLVVDEDCTGTLTFATSEDTVRSDSIVVPDRNEILGMSQDPDNLWTYRARRIAGTRR